jgi:hypothetical protein
MLGSLSITTTKGLFMTNSALELMPQTVIDSMPRLYKTDSQGKKAMVLCHLFGPIGDFYLTEVNEEGSEAFGYTKLTAHPDGAELGYIPLTSLKECVGKFKSNPLVNLKYMIERDLHWSPVPLAEVM